MDPVDLVRSYHSRGWRLTPLAPASKRPIHDDWPRLEVPLDEVVRHVGAGGGVGLVLGAASGGLVDVDLDAAPAIAGAPDVLPPTGAAFGRALPTHRLYRMVVPPATVQFKAPDGRVLVEIRSTGAQTVLPPTVYPADAEHPAPEPCRWHSEGDPAEVEPSELAGRVGVLAAASLLALHWPSRGGRHDASLALAGVLVRSRVPWAARFVALVAKLSQDEQAADRVADVESTARRLAAGGAVSGWPRFAEVFGAGVADRVRSWLVLPEASDLAGELDLDGLAASAPASAAGDDFEDRVRFELDRERARREARRRLDAEERGPVRIEAVTLRALLEEPDPPTPYRIERWLPVDCRAVLAAAYKAGKTTLVAHVVECLVDGGLFLGTDPVAGLTGSVALLDTEMGRRQLREWYRPREVEAADRVHVVPLRGRAGLLDLLDRDVLAAWATWLREREVEFVVVDCLRPVLDALGLDESREAGRWLTAFDALLDRAGVTGALVAHHMGHQAERSRGDSRIRDWPDVEWRLVRQDAQADDSPRFLSAYGRDVDVPEVGLAFDSATRLLTLVGGSREDARAAGALVAVLDLLHGASGRLSGHAIEQALADAQPRALVRRALQDGTRDGGLTVEDGPRGARLYTATSPARRTSPPPRRRGTSHLAAALIGRRGGEVTADDFATASSPEVPTPDPDAPGAEREPSPGDVALEITEEAE